MVMHARKQPRLNDGYADRKDAHLHQNVQYQPKNFDGLFRERYDKARDAIDDRSRDDSSGGRHSPRYQNKSSYIERNKEKRGSFSLPEKKSVPNHQMSVSNISRGNGQSGGSQAVGQHNNHDRPFKSVTKDPKDQKDRDHRAEVQKSAVRVLGDWSEHISSSGKRYYYNCKTEVSQWEKPKEWADSPRTPDSSRSKDIRVPAKLPSHTSSSKPEDRSKHSTIGEKLYDKHSRSNSDSALKLSDKYPSMDRSKIVYTKDNTNFASNRTNLLQRTNSSTDSIYNKDNVSELRKNNTYPYSVVDSARRRQRHESDGSRSSVGQITPHKNDDPSQVDDMEISPGSTPTSSRQGSRPTSCTAALQTLQKLQEALNMHIVRAQQNYHTGAQNSHPNQHQHSSPHHNRPPGQNVGNQQPPHSHHSQYSNPGENGGGRESPLSDMSPNSWSPTPSTSSSQNVPITTSALSGAAIKKDQSVELTPSLSNYYNEKLISHVMGWQADHAERQANRYWEEALSVGSLHCSQVSVELKKARSLVRVAEIQSTLHEQRILFLDKQISEIDNLKPPTFLPS